MRRRDCPGLRAELVYRGPTGTHEHEYRATRHTLCLNLVGGGAAVKGWVRVDGGPEERVQTPAGELFFLPAGQTLLSGNYPQGASKYLALFMEEAAVALLEEDGFDAVRVRFRHSLRFSDEATRGVMQALVQDIVDGTAIGAAYRESALVLLLTRLARLHSGTAPPAATGVLAPWQMRRVEELAESRCYEVSLSELAAAARLSLSQFSRSFRRTAGVPPHRWLAGMKIDSARELLAASDLPLCEIALRCGFSDQAHFSTCFRRATGATPSAYRRSLR